MLNTVETIILILLTVALVIAGPLMIAEGVVSIASKAASEAWSDWASFVDWLYDSIDSVIFGKKEGHG
ncbi:MAG: hypothetical protein NZ992_00600 [Candidatus Korarchaeum sp.]|nr:hypothetical protein [Candidatus Korarchaeum sp.]MDW8035233.1 hypothetical protein [Candidatus Korarchaeum sp.]